MEDEMAERRLIVSENDISYAAMSMRESIEYFILSYEKAMAELEGKHPKIILISPEDVRLVSEHLRHERFPSDRHFHGNGSPQKDSGHSAAAPRTDAGAPQNTAGSAAEKPSPDASENTGAANQ